MLLIVPVHDKLYQIGEHFISIGKLFVWSCHIDLADCAILPPRGFICADTF
jgi:hypothetical protein